MSMELMTENHKQQNSTLFVWMLFFVNLPQVSGPKYYIQYNVKWNASQLLFFEKALLLIPMTNVTLRSLIINQKFQYQAPSLSFTNGTTSIQGPSFCVKRCCSSKYHRHIYTWAIKKRFPCLDSLTKHEVRYSYENPQLFLGLVQLLRVIFSGYAYTVNVF